MARLIVVDDPADPRLADYVSLRDVQLRRHVESERSLFVAEGEKVVRRAVAAGYRADPLYRRSVKVGMGAVFALPWSRLDDWYGALPGLSAAGFTTAALTPAADALDLADLAGRVGGGKLALIVGGEGHGLSARWLATAEVRVAVPMAEGVDSLNVAAAAAIACYATR